MTTSGSSLTSAVPFQEQVKDVTGISVRDSAATDFCTSLISHQIIATCDAVGYTWATVKEISAKITCACMCCCKPAGGSVVAT